MTARYRGKARTKSQKKHSRMRRADVVVQAAVGLLVVAGGFYFFEHSTRERPSKGEGEVGSKLRTTSKPISHAPSTDGDARPDESSIVKLRSSEKEASPPVKAPLQSGSMIAPRDPALDSWFIKAYLRCWTPPTTLPAGEKYAAQIRVVHNNDGSLAGTPLLVNPPSDPAWRAFADSAVRAVTRCSPLKAPAQYQARFEQWRKMTLYFSPDSAAD